MSIVDGGGAIDPRRVKWGGYGLAAVGALAVLYAAIAPGPLPSLAAVLLPLASFAVSLMAPALFEVTSRRGWLSRGGSRGFNPLVELPALSLFVLALTLDLTTFTGPLVAAGLGAAAAGTAGFYAAQKPGLSSPIQLIITLAVAGGLYGYGAFTVIDTRFDTSAGQVLPVTVSNKHISHGRSNSYHLDLPAWGPRTAPSTVSVRRSLYEAVQPGDVVCITLHPGSLGVPWYAVGLCQSAASA